MRLVVPIARTLLGLVFVVFGLNFFFHFLPMPPMEGAPAAFMGALFATGYMFPLIKGTEVVAGAMLLGNRFVPLALTLLAPIIDGSGSTNPTVIAEIDRSAWTRAPLFIAQSGRNSATASVPADRPADGAPAATAVRDVSAIEPQSNALFVARTTAGEPR